MHRSIHPITTTTLHFNTLSIPLPLTHPSFRHRLPRFRPADADVVVNGAGDKGGAQSKLLDAKLSTEGNNNNNNTLSRTVPSESKNSGTTATTTNSNNDSINEEGEGDEAFELSPGLEKFFAKPAMDYVVDFYDAFSNIDDGGVAIMMEYMDGGSLQDIVDDGGCDDEITLANIAVQALIGLAFLHSCGQLHRDLKPGNFLISHRGDVKVADLGILRQLEDPLLGDQQSGSFVTLTSEVRHVCINSRAALFC